MITCPLPGTSCAWTIPKTGRTSAHTTVSATSPRLAPARAANHASRQQGDHEDQAVEDVQAG